MLQNEFAKQSSSYWSSPYLLEMKHYGFPCFITEFQQVSPVTVMNSYPLSCFEDCVDKIGNIQFVN